MARGRKKGVKNFTKLSDGSIVNKHGVVFSVEEQKLLNSKVTYSNKLRRDRLKALKGQSLYIGKDVMGAPYTVGELEANGLLFQKEKKGFAQFESKAQFNRMIKRLENRTNATARKKLDMNYNQQLIEKMKEVFNADGEKFKELEGKLNKLNNIQLLHARNTQRYLDIAYWYEGYGVEDYGDMFDSVTQWLSKNYGV